MTQDLARQETPCPACAEPILVAAQKCKHCGVTVDEARRRFGSVRCLACAELTPCLESACQHCGESLSVTPSPLSEPGLYNVPVRLEQRSSTVGDGSSQTTYASSGLAFKGSVCPTCHDANYVKVYSIWHGVIAVFSFPIGLIAFAFPVQRCVGCRSTYGAGKAMIRVMAAIAIFFALCVALVLGLSGAVWRSVRLASATHVANAVGPSVSLVQAARPDSAAQQTVASTPTDSERLPEGPTAKGFQGLAAPVKIPDVIPENDLAKKVTNEEDFSDKGAAGGITKGAGGGTPPPSNSDETFFDFQVEKQVSPYPGNAPPPYPDMLRSANVEGEVLAQFTVDATGRAEMATFKALKSTHDLFTSAVKSSLPQMRFYPAEVGGKKVKQQVQMPFQFSLHR